jgi:Gas vesicle protein
MSDLVPSSSGGVSPTGGRTLASSDGGASNLADVLERVLDKGVVIAGDIQVNLLDIELLTIKLRLVIAGVDTARRIGIDWWEHDPWLHGDAREGRALEDRLDRIERRLEGGEPGAPGLAGADEERDERDRD